MEDKPRRVLLVEDNPGDARLMREFLADAGPGRFTVDCIASLKDALERLRQADAYDVILLDLSLPDSQGMDTVSRMQAAAPFIPVLVLTGLDDEALGLEAIRIGAQDYLIKGRSATSTLVRAIGYATERKRLMEELRLARDELELRVQERTADLRRTVQALEEEIIARKQSEEARVKLQEQLHQAQKMEAVGQLAAGLGHDFGNLLAVVHGWASRAKDSVQDPAATGQALKAIEDAAHQAGGIVQSLLTFSCRTAARKRPVDLRAVMEESSYLLRHALTSSVELISNRGEQPAWVLGHPVQIEQIFLNLGINARDAMPDGGTLEMSLTPATEADLDRLPRHDPPPAAFIKLVFRDTGMGIPPKLVPRIFEPYFTTKERGQGTGLGLAIVHGIVQDLGGHIEVHSQLGQGTTFEILLPCTQHSAEVAEPEPPALEIPEAQGLPVLLIGTDPHSRGLLGASLRLLGCDVVQAGDDAAVEACCDDLRGRLGMVVIDQDMQDGHQPPYVQKIRDLGIKTPIVIACDVNTLAAKANAGLGSDIFLLNWPFGMPELRKTVCDALSSR